MRNFENDTLAKFYPPLKEKFLWDSTKTKLALKLGILLKDSQFGDAAFLSSRSILIPRPEPKPLPGNAEQM